MTSIWVESLGRNFDGALDLLAAAVSDCGDVLWEASMWEVPVRDGAMFGPDGQLVTDPADRRHLAQRYSTPWAVAWHALEVLDYDLTGEFAPWVPPPPFAGHPHWQIEKLARAWSQAEALGYVDHCRAKVHDTLAAITDEKAATPLPPAHRYAGQPYAWNMTSLVGHTIEHGAQIRQFITAAG